jgi:hypothetical protein
VTLEPQSLTSLPESPTDERSARMVSYSIAMGLRLVCLYLCFIMPGWWILLPATGVVVLPAIAVMMANVVKSTTSQRQHNRSSVQRSLSDGR